MATAACSTAVLVFAAGTSAEERRFLTACQNLDADLRCLLFLSFYGRLALRTITRIVRRLEAVQSCQGANAGCGYLQVAPDSGVLTLFCSVGGPVQIFGANRLSGLRVEDGAITGDCDRGSWRRDAGVPGCY